MGEQENNVEIQEEAEGEQTEETEEEVKPDEEASEE